jgi:dihydropteroate synthase
VDIEIRVNPRRLPPFDSPWLAPALAGASFASDAPDRLAEAGGELYRLDRLAAGEVEALRAAGAAAGALVTSGEAVGAAPGPDRPVISSAIAVPPARWPRLIRALDGAGGGEIARALAASRERAARRAFELPAPGGPFRFGPAPAVMGVVNVTPDSFSDGGRFGTAGAAVDHGLRLAEAGAALLDVGGESTRPGAGPVPEDEERRRVLPVVEALAGRHGLAVSIDTSKAGVAADACAAGARMINDVTALAGDRRMAEAAARAGVPVVLMHMQGTPRTMQADPRYADVVGEVMAFLRAAMARARDAGIPEEALLVDPGFGFGKRLPHNVELLARLAEFRALGRPILVGTSRKKFLGELTGRPVGARAFGTAASVTAAVLAGALVVRVHDVGAAADAARLAAALAAPGGEAPP